MKVVICFVVFAASSAYATYVAYPYVYRSPLLQNGFYAGGGYGISPIATPSVTLVKPFYPGFYDYRLGLSPTFYQPGLYPGFAAAPTVIHLIPADDKNGKDDKKKNKKKGKGKDKEAKDDDDETSTMPSEDKEEAEDKAEAKEDDKSESLEVESV